MFLDTPASFPVKFIAGDVFNDAFLPPSPVVPTGVPVAGSGAPLDLASLSTLAPLRGRVGALYASSFFHLFGETQANASVVRHACGIAFPRQEAAHEFALGQIVIDHQDDCAPVGVL